MPLSDMHPNAWWSAKLAALLHDPPWKQWIVTGRMHSISRKGHEGDAKLILEEDLGVKVDDGVWKLVRRADALAASLDRTLSGAIPERLFARKMVNVFDAESAIEILIDADRSEVIKRIEEFRNELKRVVSALRSRGIGEDLIYKVLYVALEALWSKYFKLPQLADTRVPTHTIFDHLATTAMMLNTVCCSDWILVQVDIPGIQLFVVKGRKTRDFWAGSWLLSAIAWKLIEELVDRFGPDIVLAPSLHANPFYVAYITSRLVDTKVITEVSEIEKNLGIPATYLRDGWPSQPVMPATVTLILPLPRGDEVNVLCAYVEKVYSELGINIADFENSLREYFENRMLKIWRDLASSIVEVLKNEGVLDMLTMALCKHMCKDPSDAQCVSDCIKMNYELLEKLSKVPPFGLRVSIVRSSDIRSSMKSRMEELMRKSGIVDGLRELCKDASLQEIVNRYGKVYICELLEKRSLIEVDFLWELLALQAMLANIHRENLEKQLNIQGEHTALIAKAVHEYTKKVYMDSRFGRWRYCSVCGSLPAIVRAPRYDEEGSKEIDELIERTEFLLDEGEALCPYCLIRRALWKRIDTAINVLYGASLSKNVKKVMLISTLDVASYWSLAKTLYEKPKIRSKLIELKYIEDPSSKEIKKMSDRLRNVIARLGADVDKLDEITKSLVLTDKMVAFGVENVLRRLELELEAKRHTEVEMLLRELRNSISRNLAYVKGDGDFIGKGYWRGVLGKDPESYIESIIVKSELLSTVEDHHRGKILEIAKRLYKALIDIAAELGIAPFNATTVISPSYVMSLSRALTLTSIVDAIIVEGMNGVLVYAGGDDVSFIVGSGIVAFKKGNSALNIVLLRTLSVLSELYREPCRSVSRKELEVVLGTEPVNGYSSPAILAVLLTRMNYWGELTKYLSAIKVEGFHMLKGFFAPALRAFGRSYGVLVTHYREPMWLAMASAAELEELKDVLRISPCKESLKDVVVVSYGRGRGIVTQLMNALKDGLRAHVEQALSIIHAVFFRREWGYATRSLALSHAIANAIVKGIISKSFLYDVEDYLSMISRANVDQRELSIAVEKVLRRVALRNASKGYEDLVLRLVEDAVYSGVHSSLVSVECSDVKQLHILNISRIARIVSR